MGYLWENMEKIDVQGTYEALTQAKAKLSDAETELSNTKAKLAVAESRAQDEEIENARLKALLVTHGIQDQGEA